MSTSRYSQDPSFEGMPCRRVFGNRLVHEDVTTQGDPVLTDQIVRYAHDLPETHSCELLRLYPGAAPYAVRVYFWVVD